MLVQVRIILNMSATPLRVRKPLVPQKRTCHTRAVLESHLDLLNEGTFSDVTFIVGPSKERFPCHQLFLKARSPVFETMFSVRWNQDSTKEVILADFDPKIFKKFLEFVYADTFMANVTEALELLQVAHMYDVQPLVNICEETLTREVTLDIAVEVFQTARKCDKFQLMEKAGNLMGNSLSKRQSLPSFSRVDEQTLVYILTRNDLKMKEIDLFWLALRWANNQSGVPLQRSLQDVLPLIRFPVMTLEEFTQNVVPTGLLSQATLIQLFTYFGSDLETKKSMASILKFSTLPRMSTDSTFSVPLYLTDFVNCKTRCQIHGPIKECLEFDFAGDKQVTGSLLSTPARLSAETKQMNIVLSSISIYCPTSLASSGDLSASSKKFKVFVKAKNNLNGNYEDLWTSSCPLETEEGKMAEIKLDSEVAMESGVRYCITLEEFRPQGSVIYLSEALDFGKIRQEVSTSIGEKHVDILNVCRNGLSGFRSLSSKASAQLIYKLSLKEC